VDGECHIAAAISIIIFDRSLEKCFGRIGFLDDTVKHFPSEGFGG
jgi:hypothetical protein